MKINKKNITLPVLILCMCLLIPLGCKKSFLNQTNTFGSTASATFTTSASVIALVNAVYDTYQNSNLLKKSIWYYANFLTHDYFNNGNDIAWNNYTIPSTFDALPSLWDNMYVGIARANNALVIIAQAKASGIVTPALGARLEGEAYFLRGTMYYYLTGSFGGVPLELSAQTTGLTPRSTQTQCFTQVVADMKMAESLLVSKTQLAAADLGRATTGAAYAYEGSAQMWLGNYTAALAAFNNTEFKNYSLTTPYINENEFNNQNNNESLFEIQFDLTGGNQSWGDSWQPPGGELGWIDSFSWPSEITGEGYDYASPALYYSYQTGDTRKLASVIGPGDPNISPGIIAKWGGIQGYPNVQGGYAAYLANPTTDVTDKNRYTDGNGNIINTNGTLKYPWYGTDGTPRSGFVCSKKWRDPTLTGGSGPQAIFGSQNQVLMRYAEVLLSRAECEARLGQTAAAVADLNTIRARAFGGTAPATWQDGDLPQADASGNPVPTPAFANPNSPSAAELMNMVFSEYRHELNGEFATMYLLRRAGTDAATSKPYDQEVLHNWNTGPGYPANTSASFVNYPYGPTHDPNTASPANHGVTLNDLPANRDILPIPQVDLGLNPNLKQNPGY